MEWEKVVICQRLSIKLSIKNVKNKANACFIKFQQTGQIKKLYIGPETNNTR